MNKTKTADLLHGVAAAYAELLRRQRATSSAFVSWQDSKRAHEFLWVGRSGEQETLMRTGSTLRVKRDSPLFESVQKMHATAELNPYEREVFYGYPYVIGRLAGRPIRGPLFTIPVKITVDGSGFQVEADDDVLRVNTLPFRGEEDTAARQLALARLLEYTPEFPLGHGGAAEFTEHLSRELPDMALKTRLDGRLVDPPTMPNDGSYLELVEQAALFVAPKTGYFLTSDLEAMATETEKEPEETAWMRLVAGAGDESQAEFEDGAEDSTSIYYPFQSNRSQRRVALLVDDPNTHVIRIEGPPGTGKSQTIANVACHMAATGRSVLITSQKDKALRVVDEKLRALGLSQLPMTLLRRDAASRKELRERLEAIQKTRPASEAEESAEAIAARYAETKTEYMLLQPEFAEAMEAEHDYAVAEQVWKDSNGLRRILASFSFGRKKRRLAKRVPRATDELAAEASELRDAMLDQAMQTLEASQEKATATALRAERQQIREFSALLKRDQTKYKNFSIFDRLKAQPDRARMLLKLLPVWIMAPDDVARLFPCQPGLFDLVIVDEASQVDLPSIAPILHRAKKVIISGDTHQMQPRRFAFVNQQVAIQAWHQHGLKALDPDEWLDPLKQSLLTLAAVKAEEDTLLDEHYRCLPPIISFSNERWYGGRLRIMTDETRKQFGDPEQPIVELHYVEDGAVTIGSQVNAAEARAVVDKLQALISHPAYSDASFGIICLFEDQVTFMQDLVAERIGPDEWEEHDLVVVNPDGFQGDERDVVLYSLSFDDDVMKRDALSQRQREAPHEQGMLNVAFTRAKDEIHVFHSAAIESFSFADGRAGALTDWLAHCSAASGVPRIRRSSDRIGQSDSQFESDVAAALRQKGYSVTQQYPACGFSIDMVVERGGDEVAVECDGEYWHHDEHGELKIEDLERQAVLERAGWEFIRIPYRRWREGPEQQLARIDEWFLDDPEPGMDHEVSGEADEAEAEWVTSEEHAITTAALEGMRDEDEVFKRSRELLGYSRLGNRIRSRLQLARDTLIDRGLLSVEESEYFLTSRGTKLEYKVAAATPTYRGSKRRSRTMHTTTCAACGGVARVPFKPRGSGPIYCSTCYWSRRRRASS